MRQFPSDLPSPHNREEALFQAAVQFTGAERAGFLKGACLGDDALRQRLEALLATHGELDQLLQKHAPAAVATIKLELADTPDEAVGTKVGRYKLLERIGEGGCGVVYVAEQSEPVRRRVALKVIKLGMDTRQVVARFEAERQALAMMDHPNIAKVHDGGSTESGRPYFVMELVRGIRITDYCDQNNLTTQERLGLFIKVCHAIQHAHQKGIIHRDIKPSNILVTVNDGMAVPKVIDFGIAKATEGRLTDATVYTQLHQFIGTPAYMSPEQAEMTSLDIDTRSDIYSLGVLLYELLAGSTPFDAKELMALGIDAMRKTIREQEPARPSTRFATLKGEESTTTARRRSTDTSKLMHQLQGDLDWIVMKCLEKDRTHRYETANGLAADLNRHLNHEPVVARPPSAAYRFQKAFRRNKLAFAAGASIAAALVLGISLSVWQAVRATRAEREQTQLRLQAEQARASEAKLRAQAEDEAAKSKQISIFMEDMLKGVGPDVAQGRDTTLLREVLDRTVSRLDELKGQPEVEADLRQTLGAVYRELGQFTNASSMLRKSAALSQVANQDDSPAMALTLLNQGKLLLDQNKPADAEPLFQRALDIRVKAFGANSLPLAEVMSEQARALRQELKLAPAENLYRQVLAMQQNLPGVTDKSLSGTLNGLGLVLRAEDKLPEAEAVVRQSLAIDRRANGGENLSVAGDLLGLGRILQKEFKLADAEPLLREAVALRKKIDGEDHPDVLAALDILGGCYLQNRDYAGAEGVFREAVALQKRLAGDGADPGPYPQELAAALEGEGKHDEANALLAEIVARPRKNGDDPAAMAANFESQGNSLLALKQGSEAETNFRAALAIQEKRLGKLNPKVNRLQLLLIAALEAQNKLKEAEVAYRNLFSIQEKPPAELDKTFATPLYDYAKLLEVNKKPDEAEAAYRTSIAQRQRLFGDDADAVFHPLLDLGQMLRNQGEAEKVLRQALALARQSPGNNSVNLAPTLAQLAGLLAQARSYPEAETLARENLSLREPPGGVAVSWQARNELAGILIAAKKLDDADQLVTSSCQKLRMPGGKIPSNDKGTLKNLVSQMAPLYAAANQPDKAAAWQKTLAGFDQMGE